MKYNTQQKRLALPEYGRSIQNMVDHCMTIEDREERMLCAQSIIAAMGTLFPHLKETKDFKNALWDHLAIMSDFKLDIDFPYEIIKPENLFVKPEPMQYSSSRITFLHYGKTLQLLINKAVEMEDGDEKKALVFQIANHMKKCFVNFNKDGIDDRKIFDDLRMMTNGKIDIADEEMKLIDNKDIVIINKPTSTSKKKKK